MLLVSDEIDELAVCDRVVVMFTGGSPREFHAGWERARNGRRDRRSGTEMSEAATQTVATAQVGPQALPAALRAPRAGADPGSSSSP